MLPYPEEFRTKKMFKLKDQNRYVVFGERKSLPLDSFGNLIEGPTWAIDTNNSFGDRIWDIIQQPDRTFCGLLALGNNIGRYKLQYLDDQGKFQRVSTLVLKPDSYLRSLTLTREKGYLVAGSDFIMIDSNENIVWQKPSRQPVDAETVSIGQSSDGGFYGSAVDWTKNDALDPDIYIFKTSSDGIISGLGEDKGAKLNVAIRPNPASSYITISGDFRSAYVSVKNLLGEQMLPTQEISSTTLLDVSILNNGIYLVTISCQDAIYVLS